ncbi:MAG: hypothetical protein ACQETD_04670 [Pseudomonadota bacterium]
MNRNSPISHARMLLLACSLLIALPALAVSDGNYKGSYQGESVTAVLETLSSTVTGMVTIGGEQYLLKGEAQAQQLAGELTSMAGGGTLPVSISQQGASLEVEIGGDEAKRFTLQRQ